MLSRTADHLFWMARYMERAENQARLLESTWLISLVPSASERESLNWQAVIGLNSLESMFAARYAGREAQDVLRFMITDPDNPSSIYNCLRLCRENAHAVRGTITTEMWEIINATWLEMRTRTFEQIASGGFAAYFEWVKMRSSLSRGVTLGTMLQDECYHFIRLGTLLERADSTARILDIRHHAMGGQAVDTLRAAAPDTAAVAPSSAGREGQRPLPSGTGDIPRETGLDSQPVSHHDENEHYRWAALLRSVSAVEAYRRAYRDSVTPSRVLHLLILHPQMPRSLSLCLKGVLRNLEAVANQNSGEVLRQAGKLQADVQFVRVDEILEHGLHEWLDGIIARLYVLGQAISRDVLMADENF